MIYIAFFGYLGQPQEFNHKHLKLLEQLSRKVGTGFGKRFNLLIFGGR